MSAENRDKTSKKKILLAEDDDSMRRFLEITLKRADFEVVATEDGLAAMQASLETEFDAVVADAVMPNLTGYDLCRMFRQNPDKKDVPFIILSGLSSSEMANAGDCMADAYLTKKNNLKEELTKTLEKFLAGNSDF